MPREYQVGLSYFTGKVERLEGDRPPAITDFDRWAIQVAIAERLEALVEEGGKIAEELHWIAGIDTH